VDGDPKLRSVPLDPPAGAAGAPDDVPLTSRDDDDLMLLARGGVPAAFDVLVRRHQARVLRIAARYLGGSGLAPDVVQNAFVEIYRGLPRYQPRGRFTSYLYSVLLNQCRMAHRSARTEAQALDRVAALPGGVLRSDEEILARERQRDLDRAVARLSHKLRSVVLLRFAAGLDHAKIAETLDVPLGTVKRRLFDALEKLHRIMEET
jgi:RNA polymerase sigma-70 factor (ECF subfamily)